MAQDTDNNPCETDGVAHQHALTLRRVLDATPEQIWKAWMTPELLQQWFAPRPWTISDVNLDPRPGGVFNFVMHGPDGKDYPNESEFVEIVPDSKIRLKHVNLPHYDLSISLDARPGGTLVSWVGVFENEKFAEKARDFLETANEQNLDRLAAEVGRGAQP